MKIVNHDRALCSGSLACVKACSTTVHKKEDPTYSTIRIAGVAGTFQANVCNQCGECIQVCASLALWRNGAGTVLLKKERCVSCYICVGFCPTGSFFRVEGSAPPIKCIACGACAKACPTSALTMKQLDHAGLAA